MPAAVTASTTVLFTFVGADGSDAPGALAYQCSLDGAAYVACVSPKSYSALSSAVHSFAVKAVDPSGNESAPMSHSWQVDAVAPTLTLTAPIPAFTLATGLVPAWTAEDLGAGVANADVRWHRAPYTGGFGAWVYPTSWQKTTATSTTLPDVVRGYTYCFSARARDAAGNTSPWSAPRCSAVALDDRSLTASAGWTRTASTLYYSGTATVTTELNRTLTRTDVQAKRIALVATRCNTCGTVGIYWNGILIKEINLEAPTTERKSTIAVTTFSGVRTGTLEVRTLTGGKTIQVDGLGLSRR